MVTTCVNLSKIACHYEQEKLAVSHTTITNPTIQRPGFDLLGRTWCLLNRFQTGCKSCSADGVSSNELSVNAAHSRPWTIVNMCPLTNIWQWTAITPRCRGWHIQLAGHHSNFTIFEKSEIVDIVNKNVFHYWH